MSIKLFSSTAQKAVTNTAAETTIIGTGSGNVTLPARFWEPGRTLKIVFSGSIADTGTPTGRVKLKLGATTLVDTGALTLPTITGAADFYGEANIICRSKTDELAVTGGSLVADMYISYGTTTAGGSDNNMYAPVTVTSSVDTTVSAALDVTWQWGAASASNSLLVEVFVIEHLD